MSDGSMLAGLFVLGWMLAFLAGSVWEEGKGYLVLPLFTAYILCAVVAITQT